MVVDDDDDIRTLLRLQLRRLGYDVVEAADGAEAIEAVVATSPALVILDATMPRLDGHEVIRRLRADPTTRGLPVILLTAQARTLERADGATADLQLSKPFRAEELAGAVERLLAG